MIQANNSTEFSETYAYDQKSGRPASVTTTIRHPSITYNAHNLAINIRVNNHGGSRVTDESFEYGPDNKRFSGKP